MKTLIFSDTHIGKGFDQKKFDFLKGIIKSSDKVIINGDFWDSWFITFQEFTDSKWNELFPLLLEKETVYIYGNHDPKEDGNESTQLFSVKSTERYETKLEDLDITFEHGHRILEPTKRGLLKQYISLLKKTEATLIGRVLRNVIHFFENLAYLLTGNLIFKTSKLAKKSNWLLKELKEKDKWLICGDTHYPELDKGNKFGNTGYINHGYASYILIEDGNVSLVKTVY